jgi:hypothetical protein
LELEQLKSMMLMREALEVVNCGEAQSARVPDLRLLFLPGSESLELEVAHEPAR